MVEKLEMQSAPALAAINAGVRGLSTRLCSSNKLGWDGVYLEHHRKLPMERGESVSSPCNCALYQLRARRNGDEAGALCSLFLLSWSNQDPSCGSDWRMQIICRFHNDRERYRP
jgi:hypothetical protein